MKITFRGVVFVALALFAYLLFINALRVLTFESSYDRLAPVMQSAPDWYKDLAKDVIDHESMIVGGVDFSTSGIAASWNLSEVTRKHPEKLSMPNAWLKKVANTPELTQSQLSHLQMLGQGRSYVSTADAAVWLLSIEKGIRSNQVEGWKAIDRRLKQGFSDPN